MLILGILTLAIVRFIVRYLGNPTVWVKGLRIRIVTWFVFLSTFDFMSLHDITSSLRTDLPVASEGLAFLDIFDGIPSTVLSYLPNFPMVPMSFRLGRNLTSEPGSVTYSEYILNPGSLPLRTLSGYWLLLLVAQFLVVEAYWFRRVLTKTRETHHVSSWKVAVPA